MATPAPPVSSLPPAPAVSDSKAVFNAKAYPFVDAMTQMADEMNAVSDWINANLNMVGPSTFTHIVVDAPVGDAAIVLAQEGVENGRVFAANGPGTDAFLQGTRNAVIRTGPQPAPAVVATFGLNGNTSFGTALPDGSARIQSANGIKLGNTANSSPVVLDWYEEGTFTPSVAGSATPGSGSYTNQAGRFTRIGTLVTVTGDMTWTAHSGTGAFRIVGFPFTPLGDNMSVSAIFYNNLVVGAGKTFVMVLGPGAPTAILFACDPAGGSATDIALDPAGTISFTISYRV